MNFNDIISQKDSMKKLLLDWNSSLNKKLTIETWNQEFNTTWTHATWSRYMNVLSTVASHYDIGEYDANDSLAQLRIEEQKVRDMKVTVNRMLRTYSRNETVLDKMISEINKKSKILKPIKTKTLVGNDIPHVFLSDFHYIDDDSKVDNVLQDVYSRTGEHVLVLTGDIIQGFLRVDDYFNEQWDPVVQMTSFSNRFIQRLDVTKTRKVVIIPGNHDEVRLSTGHKGTKAPTFVGMLKAMLDIKFGEDFSEVTDCYTLGEHRVYHGHQFKGKNAIKKWCMNTGEKIIHAHLHHFYIDGDIIGLPSLSDPNSYEKSIGEAPNRLEYVIINESGFIKKITIA